jgi:hypothetical protein
VPIKPDFLVSLKWLSLCVLVAANIDKLLIADNLLTLQNQGKKVGRKLCAIKNHSQKCRGDSLGVIAQQSRQYGRLRYTNRPYLLFCKDTFSWFTSLFS